jgi:hypothetical protein
MEPEELKAGKGESAEFYIALALVWFCIVIPMCYHFPYIEVQSHTDTDKATLIRKLLWIS